MDYYFTFGTSHFNVNDECMAPYWVRVTLPSNTEDHLMEARIAFIEKFSSIMMPKPDKWSFQYTEDEFLPTRHNFRGGEFKRIIILSKTSTDHDNQQQETGEHH